jgi:GH15 family glucan-1,4-alpha-glucosidase
VRNWDYRFCWLRDATFTLLALMNLGYYDEAQEWRDWLIRAVAGSPNQVQIMYGVGGERWLPELTVPWLPGYEDSTPVRIGNGASQQLQLDVFGEIFDAMFQGLKAGMAPSERGHALRPVVLEYLANGVAATGRRHLGGARRPAALRLFEGHGLGCIRSCGE